LTFFASPSDFQLLLLLAKMAGAAFVVVAASLIAERSGALVAALVATLPVSAGPVYVLLALDHDEGFIAQAALGSMASNVATGIFSIAYVLLAQKLKTAPALLLTYAIWLPALFLMREATALPFAAMALLVLALFPLLHRVARPYLAAKPLQPPRMKWYAIPLRACFVAMLVGVVTVLSRSIGPQWSGVLATFPIVMSTLALFLQPRIGGPATAAIIGSGLLGLMGFGCALAALHLAAEPIGRWGALGLALGICIVWNMTLGLMGRRRA
jgi:hypothetical protein